MTDQPPYLTSYDFGDSWIPVPEDLWKYFGSEAICTTIRDEASALSPDCVLTDGTNDFGAWFIPGRNPDNIAIWLVSGLVSSDPPPGYILEFAAWLDDRRTAPVPFIDDPNGSELAAAQIAPGLDQLYWAAPDSMATATMSAQQKQTRLSNWGYRAFLRDYEKSRRRWLRKGGK